MPDAGTAEQVRPDHWRQLAVRLPGTAADAAAELLESLGAVAVSAESGDGEERFDLAVPTMKHWRSTRVSALFPGDVDLEPVIDSLGRVFDIAPGDCEVERIAERDWERACLESMKPVEITAGLWVCPSWTTPPVADAVNVVIDPGLAFGTGTHETTHLCLEHLAAMDLAGRTVLDFGCGSGILAIAALMLGARRAFACDVDPRAIEATRNNASVNGVADRIEVLEAGRMRRQIDGGGFTSDVVVANILADALIELAPVLTRALAPQGHLLLSGILDRQRARVEHAYPGLEFAAHARGEWLLLAA